MSVDKLKTMLLIGIFAVMSAGLSHSLIVCGSECGPASFEIGLIFGAIAIIAVLVVIHIIVTAATGNDQEERRK